MSAKFCGECGGALSSPVRFCPHCGRQVAQLDQPAEPVAPPTSSVDPAAARVSEQHDLGPGQWAALPYTQSTRRPRGRLVLIGGAALVLVLGAAGAYAVLGGGLFGGDDGLPGAVSSEPSRAWRYSADDLVTGALRLGDGIVIATEGGDVIALDQDGEERWSESAGATVSAVPDGSDVVIAGDYDDSDETSTMSVLSSDDGEEIWEMDGYPAGFLDGSLVVVADEDGFSVVDLADGDVKWDADPDSYVVVPDAVYVLEGDELRKLGASDGEVQWTADASDAGGGGEDSLSVQANDEMAVVAGADAVAFSSGDGKQLWTADGGPDGANVNLFSDQDVVVGQMDFSEDPDPALTVFDTDGAVAELDPPDDSGGYLYTSVFEADGKSYALDLLTGWLYDEDHEVAERFDGQVTPVAQGFYELSEFDYDDDTTDQDRELTYSTLDDGTQWRMSLGSADSLSITALEEKIVVTDGDTVSVYE